MKPIRFFFFAAVLISYLAGIHANAQTGPVVVSSAHGRPSTGFTTSYSAQCPGRGYEIRISKKSAQVQFIVKEGSERTFDISGTGFGQTFLHKHLYGDFDMVCGKGLVLHFLGVQLQRVGQPKLVRYYFSIDNNGTVLREEGPAEEDYDEIDRLIDR
jgi:hypothetical protein